MAQPLRLVSRAGWQAARPRAVTPVLPRALRGVAVHYSAANRDEQANHANCASRVRAIQAFHMAPSRSDPSKPWNDIAYNHLFCVHGYAFEGRGFGVRSAANGTYAANSEYHAVCFLGNDDQGRNDVTDAGRDALAALLLEYGRRYPWATAVVPHSQFRSTACPGDELRRYIASGAWREREVSWPVPLPRWFWVWARWRLGRGEFKRYGPANRARRPKIAPRIIPAWAWDRLRVLLGRR